MKKSEIYLSISVIVLQLGACMIHIGLGLMLLGGWLLFGSYMEHKKKKRNEH